LFWWKSFRLEEEGIMQSRKVISRAVLVWMIVICLASAGCSHLENASARGKQVDLKVTLQGWHDLRLDVKNVTRKPIYISKFGLPWEWQYRIMLKGFDGDSVGWMGGGGQPMVDLPLSALPIDEVALLPGKVLSGHIDLRSRYPDLEETLKSSDVIFSWSYSPSMGEPGRHSKKSGQLVISRF
jgi:hypothetical protein